METRRYTLGVRGEAMEQNRQRILDAALQTFLERYYDEVTLESVAARACPFPRWPSSRSPSSALRS